jgi:hypothetical protein
MNDYSSHNKTPQSTIIIPDDITGVVTVNNKNNKCSITEYEFDNGKLLSVSCTWNSDNAKIETKSP